VGAFTILAFGSMGTTSKGCVIPLPAVVILGDARVHGGISNCNYVLPKVEGSVDEGFSFGTVLRVPNVDPDNRHIRVFRSADNAGA